MVARSLDDYLDQLPSVGLDELDDAAALLTRRDRKYILPIAAAERLVEALEGHCRVLEIEGRRQFRYESVYFDTADHVSYLGAARRRTRRFKVRTRSYLDTGRCLLEIKTRDARGRTVKERHEHPFATRDRLGATDIGVLGSCPLIADQVRALRPVLTTSYTRSTLLLDVAGVRATIDTDVRGSAGDGRLAALPGMVILESKSPGPPSDVDRILWAMGYRPTKVSKFCTSLAALFPELPSSKWTRALRHPWSVRPAARPDARPLDTAPATARLGVALSAAGSRPLSVTT